MEQDGVQLNVKISTEADEMLRFYLFKNKGSKKKAVVEEAIKHFVTTKEQGEK